MTINKKLAVTFLIANSLYVLYFFMLMIGLKQPLINDVYKQPTIVSDKVVAIIQITMSALSLIIYIGLGWALKAYREKGWIIAAVWVYMIYQLYLNLITILNIYHVSAPYVFYNYTMYVTYGLLLYLVISFLFVQDDRIKSYYRWFGTTILLVIILVRIGPILYEQYNIRWALINQGILKIIPYFISLFLFVKINKSIPKA